MHVLLVFSKMNECLPNTTILAWESSSVLEIEPTILSCWDKESLPSIPAVVPYDREIVYDTWAFGVAGMEDRYLSYDGWATSHFLLSFDFRMEVMDGAAAVTGAMVTLLAGDVSTIDRIYFLMASSSSGGSSFWAIILDIVVFILL